MTENYTESPTVALVHGAFADAGSFAAVTELLLAAGVKVQALVNPLRVVGRGLRLRRQRTLADHRTGTRGRPLLRRSGHHECRDLHTQRRRAGLRGRLRTRRK